MSPQNQVPKPKTPAKTPTGKPPAAAKTPASSKPAAVAPASNKSQAKKIAAFEESEDDEDQSDDEEDEELMEMLSKKKGDPEDEAMDGEEDEGEDEVFLVEDHLKNSLVMGITVPAGSSVQIVGFRDFSLHLKSVCLGPNAAADDRGALIVYIEGDDEEEHDHDHEEGEEHDHDHDDESNGGEEIVLASLVKTYAENVALDVQFIGNFVLFNTSDDSDMHVVANVVEPYGSDDDYDEDDEDAEDDDEEEDEDEENGDFNRQALKDDEDESEEDDEDEEEAVKKLIESAAKKQKMTPAAVQKPNAPKVLEVKAAAPKATSASAPAKTVSAKPMSAPAPAKPSGAKPTADQLVQFVLGELKAKKTLKSTDMGTVILNKFGTSLKNMGFEEKSLSKFLDAHAKGKVSIENEVMKLA